MSTDQQDHGEKHNVGERVRALEERVALLEKLDELEKRTGLQKGPWWQTPALIAALGTLAAAIAPTIVAINGYFDTERMAALSQAEYDHSKALEDARLEHEISSARLADYVVREAIKQALDSDVPTHSRLRALRYLSHSVDNPDIRSWAQSEREIIEDAVDAQPPLDSTASTVFRHNEAKAVQRSDAPDPLNGAFRGD